MATTYYGNILKQDLGLENFKFIWVQKVLNVPFNLYVITVDSRFPNVYLSISKLKKLESRALKKLKALPTEAKFSNYKLSPPVLLNEFSGNVSSNTMIFFHDIAGEYFRDDKLFKPINENLIDKGIEIYEEV